MNAESLKTLTQDIVKQACALKDKHTSQKNARVNYSAVFAQNKKEYDSLLASAKEMGRVIKETPTGPLFLIKPLDTVAGKLKLLKIRAPDQTRPERGDADFTVEKYAEFKKAYLGKAGFTLIQREGFQMVELTDPAFHVRAYFSNPPLDKQLGVA